MFLISGFHIHIARKTYNLGIKKVSMYYNEPHICYSILFSCYITSSSSITSVYFMEHIPTSQHAFQEIQFTAYNSGDTYI